MKPLLLSLTIALITLAAPGLAAPARGNTQTLCTLVVEADSGAVVAEKGERRVVFARLTQDNGRQSNPSGPPGPRARDALLAAFFARPGSL